MSRGPGVLHSILRPFLETKHMMGSVVEIAHVVLDGFKDEGIGLEMYSYILLWRRLLGKWGMPCVGEWNI